MYGREALFSSLNVGGARGPCTNRRLTQSVLSFVGCALYVSQQLARAVSVFADSRAVLCKCAEIYQCKRQDRGAAKTLSFPEAEPSVR